MSHSDVRHSDVSASWSILSTPTSARNSRTSWAHRLQKSLSQSLGMANRFDDEGRGGEIQSVATVLLQCGLSGLLRLPDEEEPPFVNFKMSDCKWREGCSLQLVCREEEEGCGERPCLVLHKGKGSWTKTRNIHQDPSVPPAHVWIHDIIAIHPFQLSSDHRPLEACVLESYSNASTLLFQQSTSIKLCLRFELHSDLLEFVSAIKSAVVMEMACSDEVPCLYRVQVSRHQRIIEAQPALLILRPSSPRPTQICLHDPLTMNMLLEIWLRDVTCIGQRTDAQQLWIEWSTNIDGLPPGTLSLECNSVNMAVRSLKAALQFHLDWAEEIQQQVTDSTVAYLRQKVELDGADSFHQSTALSIPIQPEGSPRPPGIPAVRYSKLGGDKVSAFLPRESQVDDEVDDMTEMKMTSFVNFAELPAAVEQSQVRKGPLSRRKYSTLPVPAVTGRTKSSSELTALQETGECEDGPLSRSSSCPVRGGSEKEKSQTLLRIRSRLQRLSNRAKVLPRPPSDDDMVLPQSPPRESLVRPASSSSEEIFECET